MVVESRRAAVAVLSLWLLSRVGAEDEVSWTSKATSSDSGDLDGYVLTAICFLCAVCGSYFGVVLAYFAILEDRLMRRYVNQATAKEADVYGISFSRSATLENPFSGESTVQSDNRIDADVEKADPKDNEGDRSLDSTGAQREYIALIEYKLPDLYNPDFLVSTRKQVKVLGSDLYKPEPNEEKKKVEFELDESLIEVPPKAPRKMLVKILVFPSHTKSGLPRNQVERACSLSYRLPTILMLLFIISFAAGCIFLGVESMPLDLPVWQWGGGILSVLLSLEILSVSMCLYTSISHALVQQYLNGGEMVVKCSDTTLASQWSTITADDDSYMLL